MANHNANPDSPHSSKDTRSALEYSETVLTTDQEQDIMSCSLVLSSVGISHRVSQTPESLVLRVSAENLHAARFQLQAYLYENRNWPPKPVSSANSFTPLLQPPTLLLLGCLALLYSVTGPWSAHSIWFTAGAGDADAILQKGEYYRLITALTLHADTAHLLGNCLFGGFLYHFFCKLTGNGLGLFAMLFTATLANYINVVLHGSNHLFVGFSTAVFAIIGMLAMISRNYRTGNRYILILPFMAGAALLAMIGSSGERTDLGAHFFGLLCGMASGWFLCRPTLLTLRKSMLFQSILFASSIGIITAAWKMAFL
ncbi:rhomboid family intramembrane serine protease [Desulfocapsa sp. AH-315-J15]|nr:rhomboid family intramembrane serine protease [bacterium AH-315-N22]MBN4058618.1 rhomboid family intramembrane serine protease [Desulfocapsa sp. AH-315-J15]